MSFLLLLKEWLFDANTEAAPTNATERKQELPPCLPLPLHSPPFSNQKEV